MSYEEFATTKIIVPDGPYAGEKYSLSRQPYSRHWFKAMDTGRYLEGVGVKPTQGGGTLTFVIIPLCKHLCHDRHTNVMGMPDTNMAADKWSVDIKPVILRTEYADLLPRKGPGSQGGFPPTITLDGGGVLRFMAAGGGDGQRLGFTGRNLFVTEADSLDAPGKLSVVTDKFSELKGRLSAYLESKQYRIFAECRPTIRTGTIWTLFEGGTQTIIQPKCQMCGEYVVIERENFKGWQDATCVEQARELGRFVCPKCGSIWEERDRKNAVRESIAVNTRESNRFSLRVSAVHNFFVGSEDIAEAEWRAAQRPDRDNAERNMLQDWWAMYWEPDLAKDSLPIEILRERATGYPRGLIRPEHDVRVLGIDVGKNFLHCVYGAISRSPFAGVIVDYRRMFTEQDTRGVDNGIIFACEQIEAHRREMGIQLALIDEGWETDLVRRIARRFGWFTAKGFGSNQRDASTKFYEPKAKGGQCKWVGDKCHGVELADGTVVVHHDADYGKGWLHHRLQTPQGQPGHIGVFGNPGEHDEFFKQILAEQYIEQNGRLSWVKKKGTENHYLDGGVLMGCAARMLDATMKAEEPKPPVPQRQHAGWKSGSRRIRARY